MRIKYSVLYAEDEKSPVSIIHCEDFDHYLEVLAHVQSLDVRYIWKEKTLGFGQIVRTIVRGKCHGL